MSPIVPTIFLFASLWIAGCGGLVWSIEPQAMAPVGMEQSPAVAALPAAQSVPDSGLQVQLGIGGVWKLGHVCPVRLNLSSELRASATAIEIQSVDGDGVALTYRRELASVDQDNGGDPRDDTTQDATGYGAHRAAAYGAHRAAAQPATDGASLWMSIRIGRQQPEMVVRVISQDQVLFQQQLDEQAIGRGLPSDQPLIVAIGSSMGVEELSRSSADGRSTFTTVTIVAVDQLPPYAEAFRSCDLMLIAGSDPQLLQQLSSEQWSGIDNWLRTGGAGVISLGDEAQELSSHPQLSSLLPGPIVAAGRITNPAALESLVATDDPLGEFGCVLVEPKRGRVELTMTDALSRTVPWWLSYSHGLGTLRFIASDMNAPAFAKWEDRQSLWGRLIAPYWNRSTSETMEQQAVGETSYLGYDDMVGQLRATLDVYPQVRVLTFGQVAAILVGVLLLIGPVDYYVSVKWLRRPEASWWIAGGTLLAVVVGLTWLLEAIRPTQVHVNTAQIVDVDASPEAPALVGRLWSHVFSGVAREVDLQIVNEAADASVRIDWQGLPGRGLGGLLSPLSTDRGMPSYMHRTTSEGQTALMGVGIPAAGTKCLTANWSQPLELLARSELKELPGVDQLEGQVANPLPVDLLEPVLFYHNWYYSLDSRIPAGKSITINYDTIPKDISRRLNGRRMVEKNEATIQWNPADRDSIDRLLELMMFYKAAAGQTYTSLASRFEQQLDYSNLLQTDRAILLGRLEQPWAKLVPTSSDASTDSASAPLESQQDLNRTWCRIIIPVQQRSPK